MQFNKFFVHRVSPKKHVLITDIGNWIALSPPELEAAREGTPSPSLKKRLEERKIILTEKNREKVQRDYSARLAHLKRGVSLHIVNPTLRCNQSCLYCYASASPLESGRQEMDRETAKKTVDFIWQSPLKSFVIEFQGGEPLANFSTIQFIMDYASKKRPKKNIHWRMVSNLSLMDETIARYFRQKGLHDISTSLDGPKKLHDRNRPMKGGSSHSKTVYWLDALRNDFGFGRVGALCTVTKHSLPFAEQVVEEYLQHSLPDITPVWIRRSGRAKENWESIGYEPQQYIAFWKRVFDCCIQKTRNGSRIAEMFGLMVARKILAAKPEFHSCFCKPCGAALMQASYQPDGSVYTCDEGKTEPLFRLGSVEQPYRDVFTSPNALNMVSLSSALGMLCNECKWNAYCSFCPVTAYGSQGSPVPLLYKNMECKVHSSQFAYVFQKILSGNRQVLDSWLGSESKTL